MTNSPIDKAAHDKFVADLATALRDGGMYSNAWERELRPAMFIPKSHRIDSLVLTTRLVVREAMRFRKICDKIARWRHDVKVAMTLGVDPPPLWDYISEDDVKPIERSSLSS